MNSFIHSRIPLALNESQLCVNTMLLEIEEQGVACLPQKLDISNQLITDVYEMFFFPLYGALSKSSKKHRSKKQHSYSDCIFEKTDEKYISDQNKWGQASGEKWTMGKFK